MSITITNRIRLLASLAVLLTLGRPLLAAEALEEMDGDSNVTGKVTAGTSFYTTSTGSASAPAYSFTGDSNTGVYSAGANTLNITTGGTERIRVSSAGNVGIGTPSPSSSLHIEIAASPTIRLQDTTNNAYSTIIQGDTNLDIRNNYSGGSLLFGTNATERARFTSAGLFGINETSPDSTLSVNGNLAIGATYAGSNAAPTNGLIVQGNIGIGTTSPGARLAITPSSQPVSSSDSITRFVINSMTQTNTATLNAAGIGMSSPFVYSSNNTTGVSSDAEIGGRLYVKRNGLFAAAFIQNSFNTTNYGRWHSALDVQAGELETDNNIYMYFYAGDNKVVGAVYGSKDNLTIVHTSDERVKKDIIPTRHNGTEVIEDIKIIDFRLREQDEDTTPTTGFSAQNLLKAYPEAVVALPASKVGYQQTGGLDELYMVNTSALIPIIIKQAQEQKAENDRLKTENQAMMQMLLDVTEQNVALKEHQREMQGVNETMMKMMLDMNAENAALKDQQREVLGALAKSGIAVRQVEIPEPENVKNIKEMLTRQQNSGQTMPHAGAGTSKHPQETAHEMDGMISAGANVVTKKVGTALEHVVALRP